MIESGQKHIVALIDILGFKQAMADETFSEKILENFQQIKNYFSNKNYTETKSTISIFSDTIIISIHEKLLNNNFFPKDAIFEISYLIQKMANLIINKGLLLRGAITFENFYHKDNVLFGSALIDAHILESRVAKYPRILASKKLIEFLSCSQHNEMENYFLKDDEDGLYYLDYLPSALAHCCQNGIYQRIIKKTILLLANTPEKDVHSSKILEKWRWFNNYYRKSVTKKPLFCPVFLDLIISSKEYPR